LSPLLFNFVLGYAISKVQKYKEALKLNWAYEFLLCACDGNLLRKNIHTIQ